MLFGDNMEDKVLHGNSDSPEQQYRSFRAGDLAVYPAHGVGRIESIESKVINGEKHDFYIMKVLENNMVIMIPIRNVDSVGLRDLISDEDIPRVYEIMKQNAPQRMITRLGIAGIANIWIKLKPDLFMKWPRYTEIFITLN